MDAKTEIKLTFTSAEREQVRDALLRYMTERGIGTPTLHWEICKHDTAKRKMSNRTLQRFITRVHKTNDHHVSVFHEFAKTLPYFSAKQQIAALGEAMTNFSAAAPDITSDWLQGEKIELDVRYSSDMNTGEGLSLVKKDASFDDLPRYSTLVLERQGASTFFRTHETIHNPFPASANSEPMRFETEGVAVPVEDRYLLWVGRDCLTRRPRTTIWTLKPTTETAGAFLISIRPQNPEADEETRYVRPVRLDAALKRTAAVSRDGERNEEDA